MDALITKPTLIVNESVCRNNIRKMSEKAIRNKVLFRPHFKTHQSSSIGKWFKDEGVTSITVSSVEMAAYFAEYGWNDITIAFPVNIRESHPIDQLANKIELTLLVDHQEPIIWLNNKLTNKVKIMVKIDTGYHRAGIDAHQYEKIETLVHSIDKGNYTSFSGFLAHAGHSYDCRSINGLKTVHEQSKKLLSNLKEHFIQKYPELIISVGDTPTCSTMEDFSWADEIRPGNFVFFDLSQNNIGSCKIEEISVALACPVVSIYEQNKIIIYGGGAHFSKETNNDSTENYGQVVLFQNGSWKIPDKTITIEKLSQEHGTISANDNFIKNTKVGDLIYVLPVHSCMTANLMKYYLTSKGEKLLKA